MKKTLTLVILLLTLNLAYANSGSDKPRESRKNIPITSLIDEDGILNSEAVLGKCSIRIN